MKFASHKIIHKTSSAYTNPNRGITNNNITPTHCKQCYHPGLLKIHKKKIRTVKRGKTRANIETNPTGQKVKSGGGWGDQQDDTNFQTWGVSLRPWNKPNQDRSGYRKRISPQKMIELLRQGMENMGKKTEGLQGQKTLR